MSSIDTQFKKGQNLGENHPRWRGGKNRFKCVDCQKVISFGAKKCKKCGLRGIGNPMFGKPSPRKGIKLHP